MSWIILTNILVVKIATQVSHSVNPDYHELKKIKTLLNYTRLFVYGSSWPRSGCQDVRTDKQRRAVGCKNNPARLIEELCSQRARNGFDHSPLHYHIVASSGGGHILGASHVSPNFNLWAATGNRLRRPFNANRYSLNLRLR